MKKNLSLTREERLVELDRRIGENPMVTDEELARGLKVSIHTVRADRQRLGIPEARQRTKDLAAGLYATAKSLTAQEIVGDLLEIGLDQEGLSLLETTGEMGIKKSGIVRGHTLFAQANSLAAAVVDADVVLTSEAQIKFISPVKVGEKVLAKAQVLTENGRKREVEVVLKTKERVVFRGQFTVYGLTKELAAHLKILSEVGQG